MWVSLIILCPGDWLSDITLRRHPNSTATKGTSPTATEGRRSGCRGGRRLRSHFSRRRRDGGWLVEQELDVEARNFGQFRIDEAAVGSRPGETEQERKCAEEITRPEARPGGHFDFELALQHQEEGRAS